MIFCKKCNLTFEEAEIYSLKFRCGCYTFIIFQNYYCYLYGKNNKVEIHCQGIKIFQDINCKKIYKNLHKYFDYNVPDKNWQTLNKYIHTDIYDKIISNLIFD